MRRSKPETIGDLLPLFVKEYSLEQGLIENKALNLWDELTGLAVARVTTSKKIANRKLYIYLSSSVVRQELYMMKSELIEKLNKRLECELIDEIILR
jgi:hypothetical protein